jgi:hypothetical protein
MAVAQDYLLVRADKSNVRDGTRDVKSAWSRTPRPFFPLQILHFGRRLNATQICSSVRICSLRQHSRRPSINAAPLGDPRRN